MGDGYRSGARHTSGGETNRIDGVCDRGHTTAVREFDSNGKQTGWGGRHGCDKEGCSGSSDSGDSLSYGGD